MLRKMVAERGLSSYVTFTGVVPYEEVGTYLASADIGVAPDPKTPMNDKSTMIKILEYMAYALPVVLFDLKEGRRISRVPRPSMQRPTIPLISPTRINPAC